MPINRLKEFLNSQHIKYVVINHSPAYTAQEIAALAHVRGKEMAKIVMVKLDNELAMAVLPASMKVNIERLQEASGAYQANIAGEKEFKDKFPDCEIGAMPPFGNLYDMEVYASHKLSEDAEIAFNAGSHTELIRMAYKDFERLVKPKIANIGFGD